MPYGINQNKKKNERKRKAIQRPPNYPTTPTKRRQKPPEVK
jgi:hypothetical protein